MEYERFKEAVQDWPGALGAFEELVREGCDEEFLFHTLAAIRVGHETYRKHSDVHSHAIRLPGNGFESLTGFSRKKLKTVIGRMRNCAEDIQRLNASVLANLVPNGHQDVTRYIGLKSRLPSELDALAEIAEEGARCLRLRGRPEYDAAVSALVSHVESRTPGHGAHDDKLATLIAFATDNPDLNAETIRTWRMEHPNLFSAR